MGGDVLRLTAVVKGSSSAGTIEKETQSEGSSSSSGASSLGRIVEDEQRATNQQMDVAQQVRSAKRNRATRSASGTQVNTAEERSRKAGNGLMGSETSTSAVTSIRRSTRRRHVVPNYIDDDSDDKRMKQVNRTRKLQTQAGKRKRIDGDFAESERKASDTDDDGTDNKAPKGGNGGSAGGWYFVVVSLVI